MTITPPTTSVVVGRAMDILMITPNHPSRKFKTEQTPPRRWTELSLQAGVWKRHHCC